MVGEKINAIWRRVPQDAIKPGSNWDVRMHGDPANGVQPWIGSLNQLSVVGRPSLTLLLESAIPNLKPDPTGIKYSYDVHFTWIYRAQSHIFYYFYDTLPGSTDNGYNEIGVGPAWFDPDTLGEPGTDGLTIHYARDHSGSSAPGLFDIS
jgi:hypothetical protein